MKTNNYFFSGSILLFLACTSLFSQTPTLKWVNSFGSGTQLVDGDFVKGMAKDKFGNFCITGMIQGTVDFDPSPAVFNLTSSGSDKDIYVAKYDSTGGLLWAKLITGYPFEDVARCIAIDSSDNIYVSGITDFQFPTCIIRKWTATGNVIWTKQIAGEITIKSMVTTNNGILVTGVFEGTKDFDLSSAVYTLSTKTNQPGDDAVFFAKYDFNGGFVFAKKLFTQGASGPTISIPYLPKFGINGSIPSITSDMAGNIYLCDKYADTASFALPVTTATLYGGSSYGTKVFIAKYDATGQFMWVKNIRNKSGNFGSIMNTAIKVNNTSIFISGSFQGDSLDFDPGTSNAYLSTPPSALTPGTWNTFMASYDLDGNYKWAKHLSSPHNNFLGTMKLDNCSNIYISGDFSFSLDFDPSPAIASVPTLSLNYTNAFLAKYDSLGNYKWVIPILGKGYLGQPDFLEVNGRLSFELDKNNIYFTGTYIDTLDFDPSAGTNYVGSLNSTRDFFVASYKMLEPQCKNVVLTSLLEKNKSLNGLEVYPNPFENNLTIKSDVEIRTIEIINAIGQRVFYHDAQGQKELVITPAFIEKGMYFIKIRSIYDTEISSKIIQR
jgi:hypothetical protein